MKITLLKKQGKSEVINREELSDLVDAIKNGLMRVSVKHTRELYHLLNPHRQPDGQVILSSTALVLLVSTHPISLSSMVIL